MLVCCVTTDKKVNRKKVTFTEDYCCFKFIVLNKKYIIILYKCVNYIVQT